MCFSSNVQPRKFSDIPCTIEAGHSKAIQFRILWSELKDAKGKSDCNLRPSTRCQRQDGSRSLPLQGPLRPGKNCKGIWMAGREKKWGKSALIATRGIINWRFYSMLVDTVDGENRHRLGWFQRLYQFDVLFDIINIPSPSIYHVCQVLSITIDI